MSSPPPTPAKKNPIYLPETKLVNMVKNNKFHLWICPREEEKNPINVNGEV